LAQLSEVRDFEDINLMKRPKQDIMRIDSIISLDVVESEDEKEKQR